MEPAFTAPLPSAHSTYQVPRMPATPLGILISYLEAEDIFLTLPKIWPAFKSSCVSVTVSAPVLTDVSLSTPRTVFSAIRTTFWSTGGRVPPPLPDEGEDE